MQLITKAEFARLEKRKQSQITNFISRGMPVEAAKIPVSSARRWIKANIAPRRTQADSKPQAKGGHTTGKIDAERAVLVERAERLRIENRKRRGELIEVADAARAWGDLVQNAKSRLLAMPGKLPPLLLGKTDPVELQEIIRGEVYGALTELSRWEPPNPSRKKMGEQ